jgi:hypothetical protein
MTEEARQEAPVGHTINPMSGSTLVSQSSRAATKAAV